MRHSRYPYVAIDLGSNSFHMWVVREHIGSVQTLARVKRKVRLAAGLDHHNQLSDDAMARGWQCLKLFSEYLQGIPLDQVRVVATATLRLAKNANTFLQTAEEILGCPIQVISGEEEARLIYHGVAHTTGGAIRRLVIDIGGASTELVVGTDAEASLLYSLPMGCVTWLERFFSQHNLARDNFDAAEQAARIMIRPLVPQLRQHGWQICVGASGTVQALQEIMVAQGMDERITLSKLRQCKQRAIQCGKLEDLDIDGLTFERTAVFPSGLSILLAIFQELGIDSMIVAGGALREGLVYNMLHLPVAGDLRQQTLHHLQQRYFLDTEQAQRVSHLTTHFTLQIADEWPLEAECRELLQSACLLHEIGLSVDFKQAPQHAAYLVNHLDFPGFTPAQKKLLATLLQHQHGALDLLLLSQQNALPVPLAHQLCRLLRLAIIFSSLRQDDNSLSMIRLRANGEALHVILPPGWLAQHPLRAEMLEQECRWQNYVHWPLILEQQC